MSGTGAERDWCPRAGRSSISLPLRSNKHDGTYRLMGRYNRCWRFVYSLPNLIVSVAEASRPNLDENIIISNFRHGNFIDFILRFVLENMPLVNYHGDWTYNESHTSYLEKLGRFHRLRDWSCHFPRLFAYRCKLALLVFRKFAALRYFHKLPPPRTGDAMQFLSFAMGSVHGMDGAPETLYVMW